MMKVLLRTKDIRKRLIRKNKSQNWLAYELLVTSGYMSQLMDGSRSPSPQLRERIMKKFPESSFDDLFVIKDKG